MRIIPNLTRMWLTRSVKPFTFKNEYDQRLPYADCENLGLYVHIPFCKRHLQFLPLLQGSLFQRALRPVHRFPAPGKSTCGESVSRA